MPQAQGVLPKGDDREVLYKNPAMAGFFVGATLRPDAAPDLIQQWIGVVNAAVDTLVARSEASGADKPVRVATVAVGLGERFFALLNTAGERCQVPVGLRPEARPATGFTPAGLPPQPDVLFYIASTQEARVAEFMQAISGPEVIAGLALERGHQRPDETEPFGYRDGARNVAKTDRGRVVFVHRNVGQPDEPHWADGGTYMVTMKIEQNLTQFNALGADAARDSVIGRTKAGHRLDIADQKVDPHDESPEVPDQLPPTAHVRKAGPRGKHDDTQIFRRGLPYLELEGGTVRHGLLFCSFQANPAQFDAVFNDWMMNAAFPPRPDGSSPGGDALMTNSLTQIKGAGLYFVPPHHDAGIWAAITTPAPKKPQTARLAVTSFVIDPTDPGKRFERGGLVYQVLDSSQTPVPGSEFTTESSGRAVCPAELPMNASFTVVRVSSPPAPPLQPLTPVPFSTDRPNIHVRVDNLTQPGTTGYGG